MSNTEYFVVGFVSAFVGFIAGIVFVGIDAGKEAESKEVIRQCERSGLYITEGVVVQCPGVLKSKE